jgi:uncharacterized caspase-like protein
MCASRNAPSPSTTWRTKPPLQFATAQRKLALVIGNDKYITQSLRNCVNDANDMFRTLTSIGFTVEKGLNMLKDDMYDIIQNFIDHIESTDMVLFFFAGHGTQWEDQNYLIPCDNTKVSGKNIKNYGINAQNVLDDIAKRKPFVTIFLLDCCRVYHIPNQARADNISASGLARMHISSGSLIAFACGPGETAADGTGDDRNGLFTKCLLRHIATPNEDIEMILRDVVNDVRDESNDEQIPYHSSCLSKRGIFINDLVTGNGMMNMFKILLNVEPLGLFDIPKVDQTLNRI